MSSEIMRAATSVRLKASRPLIHRPKSFPRYLPQPCGIRRTATLLKHAKREANIEANAVPAAYCSYFYEEESALLPGLVQLKTMHATLFAG